MQGEVEIPSVDSKRHALIVVTHPSVAQRQLPDPQAEKRRAPWAARPSMLRRRHVAAAVSVDRDRNLRFFDDQLVEGDLMLEERHNADSNVDAIGVKQRRSTRSLEAMHRQITDANREMPGIEVKGAHLHARAGALVNLMDDRGANPSVGQTECENRNHGKHHQDDRDQVPGYPFFPAAAHGAAPSAMMSIFSRSRVSSSHCFESVSISRWISTSRIVSSTSSIGGTLSPRAFNCGANSSS